LDFRDQQDLQVPLVQVVPLDHLDLLDPLDLLVQQVLKGNLDHLDLKELWVQRDQLVLKVLRVVLEQ